MGNELSVAHLCLLSSWFHYDMCEALGIDRIQTTGQDITICVTNDGCYENGNFHLMLKFDLPDTAELELYNTTGTLMWNRKDCFSEDN